MDHVVVDVEIAKTIEEVGGWGHTHLMGVGVACVWEYATRRMRVYGPEDVLALQDRLLAADRVSGFNILNFDYPVIWGLGKKEWMTHELRSRLLPKTDDMLRRIWQTLGLNPDSFGYHHQGWGLDAVCTHTLPGAPGKIGHGAEAPKWFQKGLVQKVVNYCADDVALERDLTDHVEQHGWVSNGKQRIQVIPWSPA